MKQVTMPKRLTLKYLLDNKLPVWVQNMTGRGWIPSGGRKAVPCLITIQIGTGDTRDKMWIPPGADPVCLTDQADMDTLRTSRDLFKAIDKGALVLLNPEEADKYYDENDTRREALNRKLHALQTEEKLDGVAVSDVGSIIEDVSIDDSLLNMCLGLKHGTVKESDALEMVMERSPSYSLNDLNYLSANGKFDSIKKVAQHEIDKRDK
ncbi:MAG: hypothetical protein WC444_04920 [Candidatus Paceibacterota bacterium]